jgi:hypothetical protein
MISTTTALRPRDAGPASLDAPLGERLMGRFLNTLDHLIKRCVRSGNVRAKAAEPFLQGRLDDVG